MTVAKPKKNLGKDRSKRRRIKYDPETLFALYVQYDGNVRRLHAEQGHREDVPTHLRTLREYERDLGWKLRFEPIRLEAQAQSDAMLAKRRADMLTKARLALAAQIDRLDPEKRGLERFNPETQAALLRSVFQALRDEQFLSGGPSERTEGGNGFTLEELEEAARHPDGIRAGLALLRRAKYGDRLPARLDGEG